MKETPGATVNQPLDPAALLRASKESGQTVPDALGVGKSVTSSKYGTGKVTGSLGNCLIVKFPGYSVPVQFHSVFQMDEISATALQKLRSWRFVTLV